MMADFLTVEDINSVVAEYYNIPFWDSVTIDTGNNADFTDVKFDYLTVNREYNHGAYEFTITVNNDIYTGYDHIEDGNGNNVTIISGVIISNTPNITVYPLLNIFDSISPEGLGLSNTCPYIIKDYSPKFKSSIYSTITVEFETEVGDNPNGVTFNLEKSNGQVLESVVCAYNKVSFSMPGGNDYIYYISYGSSRKILTPLFFQKMKSMNVVALPSSLDLLVGRVNTFTLVSESSNFAVESNYPVSITGKDVTLDLTGVYDISTVDLTVHTVEDSSYYPNEWQFKIPTSYPTITTGGGLINLFSSGGIGRLGANIPLIDDLTLTKDVLLLGNDKTLIMASHKVIVPTGKTFKAENTVFTGGKHTIHQSKDSNVELTDCTFTNCTADNGHGAVIDCSVDLESLSYPLDFTTVMTGCTISNCDMAILHGGDLTVTDCIVTGKISEPSYPYFLYQTDGTAVITQSQFNISSNSQIGTDIGFNSCIFSCGTDALINNLTHEEWSGNNVTSFLTDARNSSSINLTYYYDAIEDYITLQGDGYCHSVSNTDFVFKTGITPTRSE